MGRPNIESRQKEAIYERDNGCCQDCGKRLNGYWYKYRSYSWPPKIKKAYTIINGEVHHVIPLSLNGEHVISNMVLLCKDCHKIRSGIIMKNENNRTPKEKAIYNRWMSRV